MTSIQKNLPSRLPPKKQNKTNNNNKKQQQQQKQKQKNQHQKTRCACKRVQTVAEEWTSMPADRFVHALVKPDTGRVPTSDQPHVCRCQTLSTTLEN